MIQKIKPMREQVYDKLKDLIITGSIKPSERIIELDYAEKFKISRTPIREAIRMLELEGLVEVSSKGGVIVKEITEADIIEIYKIRIALEGVIIQEIIKRDTFDINKLEKLLDKTMSCMIKDENSKEVIKLFTNFNSEFYAISKLPRVIEMIKNLNLYLMKFRTISITDSFRRKIAYQEHRDLIEAIKNKNLEKALEINKKHLEDSMNFILNAINN